MTPSRPFRIAVTAVVLLLVVALVLLRITGGTLGGPLTRIEGAHSGAEHFRNVTPPPP